MTEASTINSERQGFLEEAKDYEELCRLVKKTVNYYSRGRSHSSIGYETPQSFTKQQIKLLTQAPLEAVY